MYSDFFELDEEPFDLRSPLFCDDVEDLWRLLLRGGHLGYRWVPGVAEDVLRHHHGDGREEAGTTALLLLTHRLWEHTTGRVIDRFARSGLLSGVELDELAESFLTDEIVFKAAAGWLGLSFRVSDEEAASIAAESGKTAAEVHEFLRDPLVPYKLRVHPPLRRWAAARLLRASPDRLAELRDRASSLAPADGGAVLHGLCDAVDALDGDAAGGLLAEAAGHSRSTVRKAALAAMARRGQASQARRRGCGDPDAKIRAWAKGLQA